ncbi:UDP-N-acetylglucosamine 2-epimerase [Thalassospira australica]|uniref:UDP-N-acetylglucosamine 2-epimerase n=1 Tax=Thalassospira australica TaxID=1528106 RepID=UPI00051A6E75|nr:UDP-N-acetylglucosamine 2-epimerase [Thalassospira australica]
MTPRRKICVVTGTRAEYGILSGLLFDIRDDDELDLQLIVTGAHLSEEFGNTFTFIEDDGFEITEKVNLLPEGDTPAMVAEATGRGVIGFSRAYSRLGPDVVVVLGDRYEILAAAQAAMLMHIPIAHIHGGETTEGAVDESIRHAVTKMAHIHFTSTELYRRRVMQLGENPKNVHAVGAPGLDNFVRIDLPDRKALEQFLGRPLRSPLIVITFHPVTLDHKSSEEAVGPLFGALDRFPEAVCVFTKANADAGGRRINQELEKYVQKNPDRSVLVSSLGQARYLGLLKIADVVVGNSSSGIIEAPSAGAPTVNIGDRQKGRVRAASVVDCKDTHDDIFRAIQYCMSDQFREKIQGGSNPYGEPGKISRNIKNILKSTGLESLIVKKFFDQNDFPEEKVV